MTTITTIGNLTSVRWTEFADTTITSTQATAIKTATEAEPQITSALGAALINVGTEFNSPYARPDTNPYGYKVYSSYSAALEAMKTIHSLGAVKMYSYYENGDIRYARGNQISTGNYSLTVISKAEEVLYINSFGFNAQSIPTETPHYAAFANKAQAFAAIANACNCSAYSYVDADGTMSWVKKDLVGAIYPQPGEAALKGPLSRLIADGYINTLYRTTNPATGTALGDVLKMIPASQLGSGSNQSAIYTKFGSKADATTYLSKSSVANATVTTYYDAATKTVKVLSKDYFGSISDRGAANTAYNSRTALAAEGYTNVDIPTTPSVTLAQINAILGTSYTASSVFTSAQLKTLVDSLADKAISNISKLSVEDGGGVRFHKGQWYLKGEVTGFFDIFLAVRVNQLVNVNNSIASYINAVQKRNNLIKQANYFLSQLSAITPTKSDDTVSYDKIFNNSNNNTDVDGVFYGLYGYGPFHEFAPNSWKAIENKSADGSAVTKGAFYASQMEAWATEVKSYISSKQTENEADQTQLETLSNKRTEITDSVSSVLKSNSQVQMSLARNIR